MVCFYFYFLFLVGGGGTVQSREVGVVELRLRVTGSGIRPISMNICSRDYFKRLNLYFPNWLMVLLAPLYSWLYSKNSGLSL